MLDLALFGGEPEFEKPLHVGRPNEVDERRLFERIRGALDRKWLTNDGPLAREFELLLQSFLGVDHCILVSSATVGLQLVAKALDLNGEVLVPSFTFIGTAHALAWIGLQPVCCDVEPDTHNLCPADVLRKATARTSAILGVHLWGRPCNIEELEKAAAEINVPLFFDAAHAIGCTYKAQPLAQFGAAAVFSLHATKCIMALEGGIVTTNDSQLAQQIRLMRSFGFSGEDTITALGINAKMDEFSAAMGLTSLESYSGLREHNKKIHAVYRDNLEIVPGVRFLLPPSGENWNYHYAIVELVAEPPGWRDVLHQILQAENVLARRYFSPGIHRSYPYCLTAPAAKLNASEKLADTVLALPTGTQMDTRAAGRVADLIRFCQANRDLIRKSRQGTPAVDGEELKGAKFGPSVTEFPGRPGGL